MMRRWVSAVGAKTIRRTRAACLALAVWWSTLFVLAFRRASWARTVREQIGRQIVFTGVDALGLTMLLAAGAGIAVVAQGQQVLERLGQSGMLGPLLITVIVRELGPVLVNFLIIARSGTAVVTELATMRVHGEARVLEIQGIEPMTYLIMPRVISMAISVFCLTVLFIAMALIVGFLFSLTTEGGTRDAFVFIESVLQPVRVRDVLTLLLKTWIPGSITGVICCIEGLSIQGLPSEVPQAATRAVVRSISALLILSAVVSILSYM